MSADEFEYRRRHIQHMTPCLNLIDVVLLGTATLLLGPIQFVRHAPVRTDAGTPTFRFVQRDGRRGAAGGKCLDVIRYQGQQDQLVQVGIDESDGIL